MLTGFLVVLAILLLPYRACIAAEFKFDPATCKRNTGNLYVALGRYVFATPAPAKANLVIDPIEESRRIKVPDPSEPLGCFDNPLQSDSHALLHSTDFGAVDPGSGKPLVPDLLTFYNLRRGGPTSEGKETEWPGQHYQYMRAERVCRTATIHEDLANGLMACRIKPVDPQNTRPEDWTATYTAKSETYATPLGKPFVINCGPGLLSDGIDHCDVTYEMLKGLGVSYRFSPYRARNPIPIDQALNFDRSLRASTERALVKDYPWPD